MGTRADFYIEKAGEKELIWLASIAWDGYPDGIDKDVLSAKNEKKYLAALKAFLSERDDTTLPENGWPWPWDNSYTTDYAYCLHKNKVLANCFGHGWFDPKKNRVDDTDAEVLWSHPFPDMSKVKNVRYDKGSGLIVLSVPSNV